MWVIAPFYGKHTKVTMIHSLGKKMVAFLDTPTNPHIHYIQSRNVCTVSYIAIKRLLKGWTEWPIAPIIVCVTTIFPG